MPRPLWKGSVSFGLVTIPVTLVSAENREEDLTFNILDSRDHAKIRYKRVNETTGEEVPWDKVVKGYEYEDGRYVFLDDEDFKRAAVEATQTVSIEAFVESRAIQHVYFEKPYFLVPGKGGEKAYVLLCEVLKHTGKVGIAKVVLRTRQYLAALVPQDHTLVLDIMRYSSELRTPEEVGIPEAVSKAGKLKPQELAMAEQLVKTMSSDWDPAKYRDEYREKLMAWIARKAEHGQVGLVAPPLRHSEHATAPINIMDLLKRSVERREKQGKSPTKARRGQRTAGRSAEGKAAASFGRPKKAVPRRHAG